MSPEFVDIPRRSPRPAFLKGMLWFVFSATAMLSAFILPVHILALQARYEMKLDGFFYPLYFIILFGVMLYHSFYRVKTILFDLTLVKTSKVIGSILMMVYILLMVLAIFLLFRA